LQIKEPTPANLHAQVTIGAAQKDSKPIDFFPGTVCEARVWGEARSAAQLIANARRPLSGYE
jgi:hypothetical protein